MTRHTKTAITRLPNRRAIERRRKNGRAMLLAYLVTSGENAGGTKHQEIVVDALADLFHSIDSLGHDVDDTIRVAQGHYTEERAGREE